jgi:hypothetical protein
MLMLCFGVDMKWRRRRAGTRAEPLKRPRGGLRHSTPKEKREHGLRWAPSTYRGKSRTLGACRSRSRRRYCSRGRYYQTTSPPSAPPGQSLSRELLELCLHSTAVKGPWGAWCCSPCCLPCRLSRSGWISTTVGCSAGGAWGTLSL